MNILVVTPADESHRQMLRSAAPEGDFTFVPIGDVARQQVQEADIIIGNAPSLSLPGHGS